MQVIAFTASRTIPSPAIGRLEQTLNHLATTVENPLWVTGACVGGDQWIANRLTYLSPFAPQRIVVPRDRSRVDSSWLAMMALQPNVKIIEMGRGTTYRDRNVALLDLSPGANRLVAFPLHEEKDERSARAGSWMTVRLARTRLIPYEAWVTEP